MDDLAGYRVLRTAGRGVRSRLLLGYDEGETVVLKVCGAGDPRVAVELEALDRAAGEHVVALLDLAADDRATTLVLARLPGGSLADLLDRRSTLDSGEAVTILAPLATTVERMHSAGVAHGSLSLGSVLFDGDGAPALVGFGGAEIFAPGAPEVVRETVAGVLADRGALAAVASLVLARVTGESADSARRLAAGVPGMTPAQLAETLYAWTAPAAVGLEAAEVEVESWSAFPVESAGVPFGEPPVDDIRSPLLPPWIVALLPDGLRDLVMAQLDGVGAVWRAWPAARRRLALGLAAAALTLVVAVALVPASSPTATPVTLETAAAGPEAEDQRIDDLPDDPVAAAVVLLETRRGCLRELSVLCLDAVVQAGSAAQSADVAIVRAALAGDELPPEGIAPGDPVLVERLGDSALLDLPEGSSPSSLLLLRTAEGWRIRQYLGSGEPEAPAFESESE